MALAFNEEQRALKETAKDFANKQAPVSALRQLRDTKDPIGFSKTLWAQMVELGLGGITFPEAYDGLDFGYTGLAGCMEEFGRTLLASPLLSSVVLSGSTLLLAGSEEQKSTFLPAIASGEKLIALALEETPRHNPLSAGTTLQAEENGEHWILNGSKTCIIDGATADMLIVSVRTSGKPGDADGISLFLIDADTQGVKRERTWLTDSRHYSRITFNNTSVTQDQLLGELGQGFPALDQALDCARICLAAEMFGGIQEIFDRTVEYLKERKQFGNVIGSYQALQHRCAYLYTEIQLCKSALMLALDALEKQAENAPALISAAKAKISETFELASNEATQLHGGIGVTDELEIGFFLKRARVAQMLFGDANFHYDRYAMLEGY